MEDISVNDKPAIRIYAELVTETQGALLFDCEGDEKWIPKSVCRFNPAFSTVDIQQWWYKKEFENG